MKSLLCSIVLLLPISAFAVDPALPEGVEVGDELYSISPDATTLEDANWRKLASGEMEVLVENGGLKITSVEENPFLELREEFQGDVLIRMTVRFDPAANHFFRISYCNRLGVEYNTQLKRFALLEKEDPKASAYDFNVVQQKKGPLDEFVMNPGSFVLTIAATSSKTMVWADDLLLFSYPLDSFDTSGLLRVRSGWHSNWAMESLAIYQLKSLP